MLDRYFIVPTYLVVKSSNFDSEQIWIPPGLWRFPAYREVWGVPGCLPTTRQALQLQADSDGMVPGTPCALISTESSLIEGILAYKELEVLQHARKVG